MSNNIQPICGKPPSLTALPYEVIEPDLTDVPVREGECERHDPFEQAPTPVDEVAHDFKNILYVIRGFTELARNALDQGSNSYRHLSMVLDAAERGDQIVAQMLASAGQAGSRRLPIDIRPVVEEVVRFIGASAHEKIRVRLTMSEDMRPVLADSTQIHQLLMNLCSNAAHSMREKGGLLHVELKRIDLTADAEAIHPELTPGPYLSLSVSDTGAGMDADVAERIFEPYFTTKEAGQGTGLGLAAVKRIVKAHGGAVTVETAAGRGSRLCAFFPTVECASTSCSLRRPTP